MAKRENKKAKKPNKIIAALLSFIFVGLGHFYARAWLRGAAWLVSVIFIGFVLALAGMPITLINMIGIIIAVVCGVDAAIVAEYGTWQEYMRNRK